MNFVEVIANYDKARNRRIRIISSALFIASAALVFTFASIWGSLGEFSFPSFEIPSFDLPIVEEAQATATRTLTRSTFGGRSVTATLAPIQATITLQATLTESLSTPIPSATAFLTDAEATRQARSNAVQNAIRGTR